MFESAVEWVSTLDLFQLLLLTASVVGTVVIITRSIYGWLSAWIRSPALAFEVWPATNRDDWPEKSEKVRLVDSKTQATLVFSVGNYGFRSAENIGVDFELIDWKFPRPTKLARRFSGRDVSHLDTNWSEGTSDSHDGDCVMMRDIDGTVYPGDSEQLGGSIVSLENGENEITYEVKCQSYLPSTGSVYITAKDGEIDIDHRHRWKVRVMKQIWGIRRFVTNPTQSLRSLIPVRRS
jgi:hypothetical protein